MDLCYAAILVYVAVYDLAVYDLALYAVYYDYAIYHYAGRQPRTLYGRVPYPALRYVRVLYVTDALTVLVYDGALYYYAVVYSYLLCGRGREC